jgi:WD40 repeat protein
VCRKTRHRGHWHMRTLRGEGPIVRQLTWSADNRNLFIVDRTGVLQCWDVVAGLIVYEIQAHMGPALSLSVCETSSRIVTAGQDRTVQCWDSKTGELAQSMEGHAAPVTSVQVSPCGTVVLSAGWDVRLWDLASGRFLKALENPKASSDVAF